MQTAHVFKFLNLIHDRNVFAKPVMGELLICNDAPVVEATRKMADSKICI